MSRPAAALLAWPLLTALLLAGLSGPHDDGQLDTRAPAPPLEAGRVLEQRFTAVADRLTAVELVLANYAKAADGRLLVVVVDVGHGTDRTNGTDGTDGVEVVDGTGPNDGAHRADGADVDDGAGAGAGPEVRVLATWEIPCASVVDNTWRRFELPTPATGIEGHLLALRVTRPEAGGNLVTVWTSGGDAWPGPEARFDGAPLPGDLALRLRYEPPRTQAIASRFRRIGLAPASGLLLVAGLAFGAVLTMVALWSVPDLSPPGLPPDPPDPMPPAATGPG
ncbi:MAG: hypothetical protein IPJ58_11975 [Ardenticatenia bacterium]|nr:hypothetical protein [Ardenticatenia bacterium]